MVNVKELSTALLHTGRAVKKGYSPLPVLRNVLLVAKGDKLEITATDLEAALSVTLDAPGIGSWESTVEHRLIQRVIKSLDDESVVIRLSEDFLQVGNSGEFSLPVISADEFPQIDPLGDLIVQATIYPIVDKVVPYASFDKDRVGSYSVKNVWFIVEDNRLTVAAADGFRLAVMEIPAQTHRKGKLTPMAAPLKSIKGIEAFKGEVAIYESERAVSFVAGNYRLMVLKGEGKVPDYSTLTDKEYPMTAALPRKGLIMALKQAALISDYLPTFVTLSDGQVVISARSHDRGEYSKVLPAEVDLRGKETFEICFNGSFLTRAVNDVEGEEATLSFIARDKAFKVHGQGEYSLAYYIMPKVL